MADELIHFQPSTQTLNVRCLNGSAHTKQTMDIKHVTCPLCLNPNTNTSFWFENGQPRNFKKRFGGFGK